METRRDLRGILFVLVVFVGLAVIWRDLRYDFNFASDMHKAELGRRRETITQTVTSIALQTQIETQTELTTEIVKLSEDVSPAEKA
ncbi:hypothetical protein GGI25_006410, partial [Coemansia spiralis]